MLLRIVCNMPNLIKLIINVNMLINVCFRADFRTSIRQNYNVHHQCG